jgi:predicted O-linked N-acetylglucosamine transferase (SPINDLY family)
MATWGHSETSGIDSVDWYVSGEQVEVPDADDHYSERLLRLPGYFMPRYPAVAGDATPIDRGVLGVPAEARLYACPQSAFKLHPDFDPVIRAILERDPGAAIVLLGSQPGWVKILRERFAATLAPHASRVHFTPTLAHRDFLRLLAGADVLLDPLYFGGCNSSIEALGLGAPVVTLPSQFLCGRFSLGLYRETEFEECVARDPDHFVELAVRVANDRDYRAWVRHEIATRSGRLFDRPDAGAALGAALHEIVGR